MLRYRSLLPLVGFCLLASLGLFFEVHFSGVRIALLACLAGYVWTYLSAIKEVRRNRHAVLRLGEPKPWLVPLSLFLPSTILGLSLALPHTLAFLVGATGLLITAVVLYLLGVWLLIRDLKLEQLEVQRRISPAVSREKSNKLMLVNPVNPAKNGLTMNASSTFPPLGLGILAALTPDDYEIVLADENMDPFCYQDADLVGITAFTSSAPRAYEIAAMYRERNIPVVLGGIHASMCPEEALKHADSVVIGEAESVWVQVIRDFEAGQLRRTYQGKHLGLEGAVIPRRDLFSERYLFDTIQTSRGCPMDCHFCSVTPFNGRTYRQRPAEEVLAELESLQSPFVFFVDDNLLGYGKEAESRAIAIFRGMVERKMQKSWFCQASLNFGSNDEVLRWASRAGCKMVFLGLESADPEELKTMHKNLNLRLNYAQAFKRIHRHKIAVLGAFIFGADSETSQSMMRKARYILEEDVDVIQTTIMTPLPGTRLFSQYASEERFRVPLDESAWARFDMSELTFHLRHMSNEDFAKALRECSKMLYSRRTLFQKFVRTWISTRSLETAFWAYSSNKNYRAVNLGR